MEKLLAVTAIGPDRAGVVRDLSQAVTSAGGSIRESRMIALGSEFAVMMLVSGNWHTVTKLQSAFQLLQQQSNLTVTVRETQPRLVLFGHVHQPLVRRARIGRTECVNVGHFRGGRTPFSLSW